MQQDLGWGTFLVWAVFNTIIAIVSAIFLKETKGKTLEEINAEFSGNKDKLRDGMTHGGMQPSDGKLGSSDVRSASSDESP